MIKSYLVYGTKIKNLKTNEIGLLICTWINKFADVNVDFATCIDIKINRLHMELDNLNIVYKIMIK